MVKQCDGSIDIIDYLKFQWKCDVNHFHFYFHFNSIIMVGMPQEIYNMWFPNRYDFTETFCVLRALLTETSTNATVLTIASFTIERYIAICHPFRFVFRLILLIQMKSFHSPINKLEGWHAKNKTTTKWNKNHNKTKTITSQENESGKYRDCVTMPIKESRKKRWSMHNGTIPYSIFSLFLFFTRSKSFNSFVDYFHFLSSLLFYRSLSIK